MTFTELELVLLFGLAILLIINHRLSRRLDTHRKAHVIILHTLGEAADKKVTFYRHTDGSIGVKPIHSLENHNGTSIQAGQS